MAAQVPQSFRNRLSCFGKPFHLHQIQTNFLVVLSMARFVHRCHLSKGGVAMRKRRLIPFLSLFMLLSSGQSMQMIERANAACPPWPRCCWQGIVTGTATVTNSKARLTTDKLEKDGLFLDVEVSQEMLDAFTEEKLLGQPVHGFIILTKLKMVGFVPTTRDHKKEDKTIPPEKALNFYNKQFEEVVMEGMKEMEQGRQQKGKS
jgi:hypothetical protein